MDKERRRAKAQCPKCGFNLVEMFRGRVGNKGLRLAEKGETDTITCPNCGAKIVPLD